MQLDQTNTLQVTNIQIKDFRCFESLNLALEGPIILIEGDNGSGKTSLLEALYYGCYLRSFRTSSPKEMIRFGSNSFFLKMSVRNQLAKQTFAHDIQVGFSRGKRVVKIDQKAIGSYKELMDHYRIISLTDDDMQLVKGAPQERRSFIDQAVLLNDPEYAHKIRDLRTVVDNRNALLYTHRQTPDTYAVFTEQLWEKSKEVQSARIEALATLSAEVQDVVDSYLQGELSLDLAYQPKKALCDSYEEFIAQNQGLYETESRFRRSLFGAHLDDFTINFAQANSRAYASRGQQKLIVMLLKIALARRIATLRGPVIFFLDDFMTDFDQERALILIEILIGLKIQLIFTSPVRSGAFFERLLGLGAQAVSLTHRK